MTRAAITLTQFLIEERRRFPNASGDLNSLLLDVASACKAIARSASQGQEPTAVESFVRFTENGGTLAGLLSESGPQPVPMGLPRGKYLLLVDALNGASNLEVNAPAGSIFSVLRTELGRDVTHEDFLQKGDAQVAAGYALYGPVTMLVLSVGNGVHGFSLDPFLGDFYRTHPDIKIPTGAAGLLPYHSMVADVHRLLLRGGTLLCPPDARSGRPRLLYEANPLGFVVEQAGGRASTGREALLGVAPTSLHQQTGLVLGSPAEIERIERTDPFAARSVEPLFGDRGLFRA